MPGLMNGKKRPPPARAPSSRNNPPPRPVPAPPSAPSEPSMAGRETQQPASNNPEQGAYDQFVSNGTKLIYSEKAMPALLKAMHGGGDPVDGLASAVASIVSRLVQSAQQAGKQLSRDVVLHGTGELIELLADLSKESGGHAYTDEEMRAVAMAAVKGSQQGQAQPTAEEPPPQAGPAPARGGLMMA